MFWISASEARLMKLVPFILCLMLIGCKPQQRILPLHTSDHPDGAYLKDLDNVLPFWTGTWEGISGNQKITLQIVPFTDHHFQTPYADYHQDRIAAKFKITDIGSNQIIYTFLSASQYDDYPISIVPYLDSGLSCTFQDNAARCYNTAEFILTRIPGEQNQIKYTKFSRRGYDSYEGGCQYNDVLQIPMPLPTADLILYRQP